jgi:large subunit ribosomal protein L35
MGKMKTKKIVAKRFKVTKSGKVLHRVQGARHLRSVKNKARQRRQDAPHQMTNTRFINMVKQYLHN